MNLTARGSTARGAFSRLLVPLLAATALISLGFAPVPANAQMRARPVMLPPTVFPKLPLAIRTALVSRGCLIPQAYTGTRENVVRGAFFRAGQIDWAVVCARGKTAMVLVFFNGNPAQVDSLAGGLSSNFTDPNGEMIGAAPPKTIMQYAEDMGGPAPRAMHDGLEMIVREKASTVYYLYRGVWIALIGAD